MKTTKYLQDITITRPNGDVLEMEVHESPTGGVFAIDFSFVDQLGVINGSIRFTRIVADPFTGENVFLDEPEPTA